MDLIGQLGDFILFKNAGVYLFKFLTDVVNIPFGIIIGFYFLKRIIQK